MCCSLQMLRRAGWRGDIGSHKAPDYWPVCSVPQMFWPERLHFKAFRKYPLSTFCDSYTWRIWIPPLFFWYFKCRIHFPLHILLSFLPAASYLLHVGFCSSRLSLSSHVFPRHSLYFAGHGGFALGNAETTPGVLGLCLRLGGCPAVFRINTRVRGCDLLFLTTQLYELHLWELKNLFSGNHLPASLHCSGGLLLGMSS